MKKISLFLAIMLLISCCFAGLVGCAEEAASGENTSEQRRPRLKKGGDRSPYGYRRSC